MECQSEMWPVGIYEDDLWYLMSPGARLLDCQIVFLNISSKENKNEGAKANTLPIFKT